MKDNAECNVDNAKKSGAGSSKIPAEESRKGRRDYTGPPRYPVLRPRLGFVAGSNVGWKPSRWSKTVQSAMA
jgi:hypothetical protein